MKVLSCTTIEVIQNVQKKRDDGLTMKTWEYFDY